MKDKLSNALDWLKGKSVDYADCRYVRKETESIRVTDGTVDTLSREVDVGVGIRVLYNGAWGFASIASTKDGDIKKTANKALQIARASATTKKEAVRLAEQEAFKDHYKTKFSKDPFAVPLDEKMGVLLEICDKLKTDDRIKTASGSMDFFKYNKVFCSTEGAEIEQDLLESGAGYEAIAYDGNDVQKRSYPNSHRGDFATLGYEFKQVLFDRAPRSTRSA